MVGAAWGSGRGHGQTYFTVHCIGLDRVCHRQPVWYIVAVGWPVVYGTMSLLFVAPWLGRWFDLDLITSCTIFEWAGSLFDGSHPFLLWFVIHTTITTVLRVSMHSSYHWQLNLMSWACIIYHIGLYRWSWSRHRCCDGAWPVSTGYIGTCIAW